jgi:hypothetical protein
VPGSVAKLGSGAAYALAHRSSKKLLMSCCIYADRLLICCPLEEGTVATRAPFGKPAQHEGYGGGEVTAAAVPPDSRARCHMFCEDSRGVPGRQQMLRALPLSGRARSARRLTPPYRTRVIRIQAGPQAGRKEKTMNTHSTHAIPRLWGRVPAIPVSRGGRRSCSEDALALAVRNGRPS